MRKNYFFFKSLLLATVLLLGSANAWGGEVSTIYTKNLAAWSSDDVTKTEGTKGQWYNSTGIVKNEVLTGMMINATYGLRLAARNTTATATLKLNRTANTIVTIDAVWNVGSASSDANTPHNQFIYGDFMVQQNVRSNNLETTYKINGKTTSLGSDKFARGDDMTIHLKVNSYSGEISEFYIKNGETTVAQFSDLTKDNNTFAGGSNYDNIQMLAWISASSSYAWCAMKSITIQQETQDVGTPTTYTIQYRDESDNEIKSDVVIDGLVDDVVTASAAQMADIVYNEQKYIYKSGNTNITLVESAASNVITLVYREAENYSYTINATDGTNILKTLESGSVVEGNQLKVSYPLYINVNGTLYTKGATNKEYRQNVSITEDNQVVDFVYSATDIKNVVYHSEGEEITGASEAAGGNMPVRSSNAKCGYTESDLTLINLPAGSYRIFGVIYSNSSAGVTMHFQLGGDTYDAIVSGSSNWSTFSQEFTFESAADVKWLTSGNATNGLDFVYIQKTAEIFTISSSTGLATLYTSCPLDFANATPADELKAYTVTVSLAEDEVTPTQVDNVPAQTGVILKGVEGHTYTIPVLASSSTAKGALIGSTTATAPDAFPGYDLYGLAATLSGEAEFRKVVDSAIPAGRAFLKLTSSGEAKVLRVVDGQASEVTAPEVVETEEPEVLYNMAGIPVGKDFKGYVINQKGEKRLQR